MTKLKDRSRMDTWLEEFDEEKINFMIIQQLLKDFPGLKPQVKQWIDENS